MSCIYVIMGEGLSNNGYMWEGIILIRVCKLIDLHFLHANVGESFTTCGNVPLADRCDKNCEMMTEHNRRDVNF